VDNPIIFAKELDGRGGAVNLSGIEEILASTKQTWLHFDANHEDTRSLIQQNFKDIDEYSLQAILDEDARPRTLQLDSGMLLILRGINYNNEEHPEDMVAVRLWISDNRLISLRYRKSRALMSVSENLDIGKGPKSIGDIVSSICSLLFSYIETTISGLEDKMDDIESRVVDDPNKQLRNDIATIRKTAIMLRRYIAPQKDAMSQLKYAEVPWLDKKHQRRLQESQDSLLRSVEALDAVRERSQVVKDELVNALSDKLNRNLYVISVVTAIFLPLGFLTGLFGINVGGMPGVDDDVAFKAFSLVLAGIVFVQVALFKYFKWF
jgi:zinc transporter